MPVVIVKGEGVVLGRPLVTNGAFAMRFEDLFTISENKLFDDNILITTAYI